MEIITIATRQQNHHEHQWQINDGRMKPARASTASDNTRKIARVSMSTQGNQRTHRNMRTRFTTNISAKSNDASKMSDATMTIIGTNIFCDTHTPGWI